MGTKFTQLHMEHLLWIFFLGINLKLVRLSAGNQDDPSTDFSQSL